MSRPANDNAKRKRNAPTWHDVLTDRHRHWVANRAAMRVIAQQLGYPYYFWGGVLFATFSDIQLNYTHDEIGGARKKVKA